MSSQFEKEFLIVGVVAGAFIALYYDLLQELITLVIPVVHPALIKTLASFVAIASALIILKRYLKSMKECDDSKNSKTPKTTNENTDSKKRFGQLTRSEMVSVFILIGAGAALTYSTTVEGLEKFIAGLIASTLFIIAIFRKAKSANKVQDQIDKLQDQINKLKEQIKKPDSDNDTKSDSQ